MLIRFFVVISCENFAGADIMLKPITNAWHFPTATSRHRAATLLDRLRVLTIIAAHAIAHGSRVFFHAMMRWRAQRAQQIVDMYRHD